MKQRSQFLRNKQIVLWMAIILVICASALELIGHRYARAMELRAVQLLPEPKPLPLLQLESNAYSFTSQNFSNRWSLVFFGYTHCPDICPVELQQLGELIRRAQQHHINNLQVIFISLDPARDSPEKIAAYLAHFNKDIIGVRANDASLGQLGQLFSISIPNPRETVGVANETVGSGAHNHAEPNYLIDHSARIFIVDPKVRYLGSFAPPHKTADMWADLQMIIK